MESIICSAIHYHDIPTMEGQSKNGENVKGLVVCGQRHCHCIRTMFDMMGLRTVERGENASGPYTQGFLTNKNRFVDRKEGYEIARQRGQLSDIRRYRQFLYSEDLW